MEVPWRAREEIEGETQVVLNEYSTKIKQINSPPIPVENIIESFLGLQLEIDDLNKGSFYRDNLGYLFIEEKKVVIDSELENQEGRYNFTCAHEVGHWVLHKDLYLQNKTQIAFFKFEKSPSIVCRESQKKKNIEWQADYFAGALLMPKEVVRAALRKNKQDNFTETFTDETLKFWGMNKEDYCRMIASLYNKRFGVSIQAMQIRLEELGFLRQEVGRVLL